MRPTVEDYRNWEIKHPHYQTGALFFKRLEDKGFDSQDVEDIIRCLDNLCLDCWANEQKCYCENDE